MGKPTSVTQTPPSGDQANAVVQGAFAQGAAGVTQSASFMPYGPFNLSLWGNAGPNGNWTGSVQLERSFDAGTTWVVVSTDKIGTQAVYATANKDVSVTFSEVEKGVIYRLNCTLATTGPINYRLSATGQAATSLSIPS